MVLGHFSLTALECKKRLYGTTVVPIKATAVMAELLDRFLGMIVCLINGKISGSIIKEVNKKMLASSPHHLIQQLAL